MSPTEQRAKAVLDAIRRANEEAVYGGDARGLEIITGAIADAEARGGSDAMSRAVGLCRERANANGKAPDVSLALRSLALALLDESLPATTTREIDASKAEWSGPVRYRWIEDLDASDEAKVQLQRVSVSIVEGAVQIMARELRATNAKNYVCQVFETLPDAGFELTARRWDGESPLKKIERLECELAALRGDAP